MSPEKLVGLCSKLTLAGALTLGLSCGLADPAPPPNVLVISIDTLRADRLSLYGYERWTSPSLGALASEGLLFTQAFSHAPVTTPSHMSMFTGQYQELHQAEQLFGAADLLPDRKGAQRLDDRIPTMATILQGYGYRTAAVTGGGNLAAGLGFDQGFEQYLEITDLVEARLTAQQKIEALKQEDPDKPFFFFFHTYEVHAPYVRRPFYRTRFGDDDYQGDIPRTEAELVARSQANGSDNRFTTFWDAVTWKDPEDLEWLSAIYDESIRAVDDQLGLLFDFLEEDAVLDNTLIVVLSDHGEEFREHGKNGHRQIYQELLHVPLILRLPPGQRDSRPGLRIHNIVRLVDVLPTVLDLLQLPMPSDLPGKSLLRLVQRGEVPPPVVWSSKREAGLQALRIAGWKLILTPVATELYDLTADAAEQTDLSERQNDEAKRLQRELERLVAASRNQAATLGDAPLFEPDAKTLERLRALGYL